MTVTDTDLVAPVDTRAGIGVSAIHPDATRKIVVLARVGRGDPTQVTRFGCNAGFVAGATGAVRSRSPIESGA